MAKAKKSTAKKVTKAAVDCGLLSTGDLVTIDGKEYQVQQNRYNEQLLVCVPTGGGPLSIFKYSEVG